MEYDLIIRGTTIVDGSGEPAFTGSVAVLDDRIAAVGDVGGTAAREIDGTGMITCPGFIDTHSHADLSILQYPLAESLIMQGITTFLGGNCGSCLAPLKNPRDDSALRKRYSDDFVDRIDWSTFDGWLSAVEREGISVNYAPLVGHGAIRTAAMGEDFRRPATRNEIQEMKAYAEDGMRSGGFGLSSFFDPSPGEYASLDEMVQLTKVAQQHGGIYTPHTRFHQDSWVTDDLEEHGYGLMHAPRGEIIVGRYHGLLEAVEIARRADIRLLIAHFTPAYILPQPQPRLLQEAAATATLMDVVDTPRQEGLDVFFNVIAFPPSIGGEVSMLGSFMDPYHRDLPLPEWMKALTTEEFVRGLKTDSFRDKVKDVFYSGRIKFFMVHPLINPYWMDCFTIVRCQNQEYVGKTVGDIARRRSTAFIRDIVYDVSLDTVFDILIEDPATTWAVSTDVRENPAALSVFLKHPCGIPCTDTRSYPARQPEGVPRKAPPIAYGLFPYYFRTFVQEEHVLSLEEAVRKATQLPADVLGLSDRGRIAAGALADLVLFDLDEMEMRGDFAEPSRPPGGIKHVLVNGQVVYENMTHQGIRSGRVLRHSA